MGRSAFAELGDFALFARALFPRLLGEEARSKEGLRQAQRLGVDSLTVVNLCCFFIGLVLVLQTAAVLADGATIPLMLSAAGTRDALTIERFSASHSFGDLETSGRIDLNDLSWSMDTRVENGQLGGLSDALDGPFSIRTLLEGQLLDRDTVHADVVARDVTGQIGALPLTGSARVSVERGTRSAMCRP